MQRVFGKLEAIFDISYLIAALAMVTMLLVSSSISGLRLLAGIMVLILALGDSFHLLPRVASILTGKIEKYAPAMGRGKQITSATITIFYLLLCWIGVVRFQPLHLFGWNITVTILAVVRVALCLFPQNHWLSANPPVSWGVARNIPFFLLGMLVAGLYFFEGNTVAGLNWVWLAILLSFAFYLPVVLWSNPNRRIGMLMLPKTCMYLWLMTMCFSIQ